MTAKSTSRATSRTRKGSRKAATAAPKVTVPFRETPEYRFKCHAEEASKALREAAAAVVFEFREVGPHRVFCSIGQMADGSERILMAFVTNSRDEIIATVGPLDTEGIMWLSRTSAEAYEQSRHRTLLAAVDQARAEAVERGVWTAGSQDEVLAAYAAHPRTPACEHCGR